MSSFTICPPLVAIPPDYKLYEVLMDFEYHVGAEDSAEVIYIKKGTITDGASIPKLFWSIIGGPLGPYAPAAVVHDELYKRGTYTRKKSDYIFYEAMQARGVAFWRRWIMHKAVRLCGWKAWNKYRRQEIK